MHTNTVKNFLQSNDPLMLVLGDAGSGKTQLLEQLVKQLSTAHAIVCLYGKQHIKPRFMIQELSNHWHVPLKDQGQPFVDQLHTLVNGLIRDNQEVFLVIDDAHLLAHSILAALVHVAITQGDRCHLHLLLLGKTCFLDRVQTLYDQEMPIIRLGKLPPHKAREHIENFLEQNHISANNEVINNIVDRLYKESHGVSSHIDKLLRQLTLKDFIQHDSQIKKTNPPKTPEHVEPRTRRVVFLQNTFFGERGARGFAVFGLLATMFGLYWYEHHMPSVSPPLPTKAYHYPLAKAIPLKPVVTAKKQLKPVVIAKKQLTQATPPVSPQKSSYTIQLMGSFDKAKIENQLTVLHLPQAQIFNEHYQHKPWYVLGFGNYTTRKQAEVALHQLPQSLQKTGAWVRPIHYNPITQ